MPFRLDRFSALRPYLYHLTAATNIDRIRETRALKPASTLFRESGQINRRPNRRTDHEPLVVNGRTIWIRDQKPLHQGAIEFELGWDITRLVQHLDKRIFFWPGDAERPIASGLNHYRRYEAEKVAIIRICSDEVLLTGQEPEPTFCRFNSGAPRVVNGRRSPRGGDTFVAAGMFNGSAGDVVEVVFRGVLRLPQCTELSPSYSGPWRSLFDSAG
jgi:hypothetical protein